MYRERTGPTSKFWTVAVEAEQEILSRIQNEKKYFFKNPIFYRLKLL
jgi:hypothetical protein